MTTETTLPAFQAQLLTEALRNIFGEVDAEVLSALTPMLEWLDVEGGETVVHQGGIDNDLYFIISGRLRAFGGSGPQRRAPRGTEDDGARRRFLGDMARGETIGEVAIFTGAPRSATVIAARDSVLVRLSRENVEKLLVAYPRVTMNMAQLVISRLARANSGQRAKKAPVNLCLCPITSGVDAKGFGSRLAGRFPPGVPVILLTSAIVEELLGIAGVANASKSDGDQYLRLTKALDEIESRHATVIYAPDADLDSAWSQRCLRMADRVLLLADAKSSPELSHVESRYLSDANKITNAEQFLVLLHPAQSAMPRQTVQWLDRRSILGHLHIRPELDRDLGRLARTQSARAIGLVFSGGGARCIAQLGVYKALQEFGIQIDYAGGTSLGAVMAVLAALDMPASDVIAYARDAFKVNPTGDVSLLPITALIKGRRLSEMLDDITDHLVGVGAGIEDTWKPFFCVTSNFSKATEVVLKHGLLAKSLRASCAIPGLLPPVPINGDLMIDGGAFNNFPVDVMARNGVSKIIGANISRDLSKDCDFDEIPGNWTLVSDTLTGRRRKYRVPSLMTILMDATTLYSESRAPSKNSLADLNFTLNVRGVGLLAWDKFDYAVEAGYRNAHKVLSAMTAEQLALYRAPW